MRLDIYKFYFITIKIWDL